MQRWLKFSKYLPNYQWDPIIYTPENPEFNLRDETLLKDVSPSLKVYKRPIWEPFSVYRRIFGSKGAVVKQGVVGGSGKKSILTNLIIWIRGNFFIPDPRVFWVKPSVRFLTQFIKDEGIELVVTTGPPHSMHLIGLNLKKNLGIKWVADFRDPWSQLDLLHQMQLSRSTLAKHLKLEKEVLKAADKVILVNDKFKNKIAGVSHKKLEIITNGFDEPDFSNDQLATPEKFILCHFGLLNEVRNPEQLWKAFEELCEENESFHQSLELRLGGIIDDQVRATIESNPLLLEKTVFLDYLSHDEVIQNYYHSSILLLLLNKSELGKSFMTGKIFEYLAVKKPILATGYPESDAGKLINKTKTGEIIHFDQKDEMKAFILKRFSEFPNTTISCDEAEIAKYSRENLTRELSKVFNKTLNG